MRCLVLFAALIGCQSSPSSLTAEQELLLSATNGPEEALSARAEYGVLSTSDDPDAPPLFRECDADGFHEEIFSRYDTDASGDLGDPEREEVESAHAGRDEMEQRHAHMRFHLLGLIYDTDEDGSISASEQSVLFDDFTVRCEALTEMLLAAFDADADGELDDDELATAGETLEAEREAMRAELDERHPDGPEGPPPEPGSRTVPPGLEDFDADGDELLSDAELEALRTELREHVRNGDPIFEPPPVE